MTASCGQRRTLLSFINYHTHRPESVSSRKLEWVNSEPWGSICLGISKPVLQSCANMSIYLCLFLNSGFLEIKLMNEYLKCKDLPTESTLLFKFFESKYEATYLRKWDKQHRIVLHLVMKLNIFTANLNGYITSSVIII